MLGLFVANLLLLAGGVGAFFWSRGRAKKRRQLRRERRRDLVNGIEARWNEAIDGRPNG